MLQLTLVNGPTCITAQENVAHKTEMEPMGIDVTELVKISVATVSINLIVSCDFEMLTDWILLMFLTCLLRCNDV